MFESLRNEFLELLAQETAELQVKELHTRGALETISQMLIYGSTIGAFGGLWKIIELWVKRHANIAVKITYKAEGGATINIEYNKLTKSEVDRFINEYPPKVENPVKIILSKE